MGPSLNSMLVFLVRVGDVFLLHFYVTRHMFLPSLSLPRFLGRHTRIGWKQFSMVLAGILLGGRLTFLPVALVVSSVAKHLHIIIIILISSLTLGPSIAITLLC